MTPKKTGKAKPARPIAGSKNKATAAPSGPGAAAPVHRRDATGHLDPRYAARLRAESGQKRGSEDVAFVSGSKSDDDLAEELAEEAVATMTSGEYEGEDALDQVVEEETGGPFVESTAGQEFAEGTDASNPDTATREPFPKT